MNQIIDNQPKSECRGLIVQCLERNYRMRGYKPERLDDEVDVRLRMLSREDPFNYYHRDSAIREVAFVMKDFGFSANKTYQVIAGFTGLRFDTIKILASNRIVRQYATVKTN